MTFPKYTKYKDSGVEWLGEVPMHWTLKDLKYCCKVIPSNVDKKSHPDEQPVRLCNYTDVYYNNRITSDLKFMRATARKEEVEKFQLKVNDVVITKDSETADDIAVPAIVSEDIPGVLCGYHLAIIRAKENAIGAFLNYLFQSDFLRYYFEITARGLTRVGLSESAIGSSEIAWPSVSEQEWIAAFLDHETARIDALIKEQKRLIELLKEKRQAVISRAVTKGLDPNVPMKDSGVEWLGEVPKHWKIKRVAEVFQQANDQGLEDLPVLRVSIHHGVSDKELSEAESDRKITRIEDKKKYKRVFPGDLVYNMMRAWQGGFGAVNVEGLVSPAYVVARPINLEIRTDYVEHLLRTGFAVEEMRRLSYGITDFRLRLYWDQFRQLRIPVPPRNESEEIIDEVARLTKEASTLRQESERQIALLLERRSALISAAVTGKIDVRNWEASADAKAESYAMAAEPKAAYEPSSS